MISILAVILLLGGPASLQDATAAYFGARLDEAETLLAELEKTEFASVEISGDRAKIHLLRSAMLAKRGSVPSAEEAARRALLLDPDIDTSAFPPSVQTLVAGVLAKLPERVVVRVKDARAGGEVRIDGRPVPESGIISVFAGTHQLAIRDKEGRSHLRSFTATKDLDVSAALAGAVAAGPTPTPFATAKTPVPVPTRNPAVRPPETRKPLVKKPLFWGGVGALVVAAVAGAAVATSGGTKTNAGESDGRTTITWP